VAVVVTPETEAEEEQAVWIVVETHSTALPVHAVQVVLDPEVAKKYPDEHPIAFPEAAA